MDSKSIWDFKTNNILQLEAAKKVYLDLGDTCSQRSLGWHYCKALDAVYLICQFNGEGDSQTVIPISESSPLSMRCIQEFFQMIDSDAKTSRISLAMVSKDGTIIYYDADWGMSSLLATDLQQKQQLREEKVLQFRKLKQKKVEELEKWDQEEPIP